MLVVLLNMPRNVDDWNRWALHHRTSHDAIRFAVAQQKQINLPEYLLEPIALNEPKIFLQRNASAHSDMNGALGNQGSDLLDVDVTQERELQAWIYLHYLEHQTAEQRLGITS